MIDRPETQAIARAFGFAPEALFRHDRTRPVAEARFALFLLLRETGLGPVAIAAAFDLDHSSVSHGVSRCRELIEVYPAYHRCYERARYALGDVPFDVRCLCRKPNQEAA